MNKIGAHFPFGSMQKQNQLALVRDLDPSGITVVADFGLAIEMHNQQAGRCRVLLRDWPYEGDQFKGSDPRSWWDWQRSRGSHEIARSIVNEGPVDSPAYLDWVEGLCVYWIELRDRGESQPSLTIGQVAVGNIGDGIIAAGKWNRIMQLVAASRGGIHMAFHVYWMAHCNADDYAGIMDLKQSYNISAWGEPKNRYHTWRHLDWIEHARNVLHLEHIAIDFTECFWDTWPDVQGHADAQQLAHDFNYGQALRGYQDHYRELYQHMTGINGNVWAGQMLNYFMARLDPWIESVQPFCAADYGNEWADHYGLTRDKAPALIEWMIAQNKEAVPMAWKRYEVVPHAMARVNKREQPSLKAKILGQYDKAEYLYAPGGGDIADGWLWSEFSYNADGSDSWFMALSTIDHSTELLSMRNAPQPDPAPDTVTLTITLTTAQMATLRDSVDVWRAVWEQIFPQVKGWEG